MCSTALTPECTFGRLRSMVLPPSCVRLLSRNFSKMHCFRIPEAMTLELGETEKWDWDVPWLGQVLSTRFCPSCR